MGVWGGGCGGLWGGGLRGAGGWVAGSGGHVEAGIDSGAAAGRDAKGAPWAALNVSGASAAFAGALRRGEIGRAVKAAARDVSARLGWTGATLRMVA